MPSWGSVIGGIAILAAGAAVLGGLTAYGSMRAAPAVPHEEETLHVRAAAVQPGDYPVTLSGYGAAAAVREVSIAPEVAGRIVSLHPDFKTGGLVREGEVLFAIDPAPYAAQLAEAESARQQQEAAIQRIQREWDNDKSRHAALGQTATLAERELTRAQELETRGIGSKVESDRAERGSVEAASTRDLHAADLGIYPVRLREAQAMADGARAVSDRMRLALEQTQVKAPFTGRIRAKSVDVGQRVAAGAEAARLADDARLEIVVAVDSGDARAWLQFSGDAPPEGDAWFPPVAPVDCVIRWSEDEDGTAWAGRLERVAGYDAPTRMVQVVVSHEPGAQAAAFPLVAGMFCKVEIPGRALQGAYRLPREAIGIDGHVYLSVEQRLKSVPVTLAREEGPYAYVDGGLNPGDTVVLTRLVDALDNTLLKVDIAEEAAPAS